MKIIHANSSTVLALGRCGENLARKVIFDITDFENLYGVGTVEVLYQRPNDAQPYPLAVQRDGTIITWNVTSIDTAIPSEFGKCELRYYSGETLVKSKIWQTWVENALLTPSETTPPEPEQGWVDQVLDAKQMAEKAAVDAKADADRAAGVVYTVNEAGSKAVQSVQSAGDTQVQRVTDEGTTQTANAKAQANAAAQSAAGAAQSAQEAAESADVYGDVVADVNQLKQDLVDFKDGFARLNLFKYAELLAEGKLAMSYGGHIHLVDDSRFNTYIMPVDGMSIYTANEKMRYAIALQEDKYTSIGDLVNSQYQVDTSLYSGIKYLAFSLNKTLISISDFIISKGSVASDEILKPNWYINDIETLEAKIQFENAKINDVYSLVDAYDVEFEDGTIAASGMFYPGENLTIRSKRIIFLKSGTRIYTSKDYLFNICVFSDFDVNQNNSAEKFVSKTMYTDTVISEDCFAYITITSRTDGTPIDAEDAANSLIIGNTGDYHKDNIRKAIYDELVKYADEIEMAESDLTIPIMTDIHWDSDREPFAMFNYLANRGIADYCFCLGDLLPKHYDTKEEAISVLKWMYNSLNRLPMSSDMYILIGNHDTNVVKTGEESDRLSMVDNSELYSLSGARTKNGYYQARKNYGFIDIDRIKVRLIWLDCADVYDHATGERLSVNSEVMIQQEQYDWFANVALMFTDKDNPQEWSVITATHAAFRDLAWSGLRQVVRAFITGGKLENVETTCTISGANNKLVANVDYTSQGAMTYICNVCGHSHADVIQDLGLDTNVQEVKIACERTGALYYDENGEQHLYERHPEDKTCNIIDTLILDKANRTVKFKRFGVGADRQITY